MDLRVSERVEHRSLTDALARLVLERPVDGVDRERAARHVLDWVACALAGIRTEIGERLTDYGRAAAAASGVRPGQTRDADSPMPALGVGVLPREQSLTVNAALGNILEMDDIHRTAILHPGPVVVPAVLTVAAQRRVRGHAALDAIVRGYEAMIRVGRSFGREHYRHWHLTGTAGPFGAAAATGSLLGLSSQALRDAFGHAGSVAGGLWQTRLEPSMTKSWHNARAASHGVLAAELAVGGFTGPSQILEGELGLFAAMCGDDARPDQVLAEPEADWLLRDTSLKPWPACRHAHAALEAALLLRGRLEGRSPERVEVLTYGEATRFCDRRHPKTVLEAKFSLQHVVAVTLLQGEPGLIAFDGPAREDAAVGRLRERVEVIVDDVLDRAFPRHYGAIVRAWTSGRADPWVVEVPDALGDPPRLLDDARLNAKTRMLMDHAGIGRAEQLALASLCIELAEDRPVVDLAARLAAVGPGP